ncbi:MAG: PQQ-dependent sugar dehydrogenase [Vulcanimicrobiaceae bacterium]
MEIFFRNALGLAALSLLSACGRGGSGGAGTQANAAPGASGSPGATPPPTAAVITLASGFSSSTIANVPGARELATLPNGDLLVGTSGASVYIVPGADAAGAAWSPQVFATFPDSPTAGVAYGNGYVYASTQYGVWRMPYHTGDLSEANPLKIASVRTGGIPAGSDGDVHRTTSVVVGSSSLFVGVGSSCNACTEIDPTRATIQQMNLDGSGMTTRATRIRNAIALARDSSGALWAGGAGQDDLPAGHPYEFFDDVSSHGTPADYGWPVCEENHLDYGGGSDNCAATVAPLVEFPAYSTIIAAVFYPASQSGPYTFPASYRGGAFVSMHGSWHTCGSVPCDGPHVAYVPFSGEAPATAVDWSDLTKQWTDFMDGFQDASGNRIGRTTGLAVGSNGSLFVADDSTGNIYRVRPH